MSARKVFAALRGLLGAFLGAYLAVWLWRGLVRTLWGIPALNTLVLLDLLTFGPAAYLGYWCFRGLRQRQFAFLAAWGCALLALPLNMGAGILRGWLISGFCLFFSRFLGQECFLRYVDPAWYRDPRRIAAKYGRGKLSSHWHISTGFGPAVPGAFSVNEGGGTVLRIQGGAIRVEPHLRKGWTFSVQDVAGVIIAPGVGHCVLYNARDEALAVFCMSSNNGEMFAKYLKSHDVPFHRLTEVPPKGPIRPKALEEPEAPNALGEAVWEAVSEYAAELESKEESIRHTDLSRYSSAPDIALELRRTLPVGALIAGGLALGMAVFFVGFPVIALHGGPYEDLGLKAMLVLVVVLIAGPWAFAAVKGELYPARLSVEYGHIWLDKGFFPLREIRVEDIGGLRWDPSDECYILFAQNGKTLAKFSTRDTGGPQFMNFLTDHNIRIRSEK